MSLQHIHIISLDVPYPVDYGGVVDLFYKIKTLHQQGIKIHLHCFTKPDRKPQAELDNYCETVNYYPRNTSISAFSFYIPYMVNSRKSDELLSNLQQDNYPILIEGIHCTYYLFKRYFGNRKVIVRLHNVEFEYYNYLAKNETNLFKKIYYHYESFLLKKYEKALAKTNIFLAVSAHDVDLYKKEFNATNCTFLPVFTAQQLVTAKDGKGNFCLYHGNLSINENTEAATWLIKNVFDKINLPFVLAGKNPPKKLVDLAKKNNNICLVTNPSQKDMEDLIVKAQVHILPSFNNTGVKLKLINALYCGRHCIVNDKGVAGSGLQSLCHIANTAEEIIESVQRLYQISFTQQEIENRQGVLQRLYNNEANATTLIKQLG
jgi:glycosyltransferase involved in cell wall biosynthesis